MRLLVEPAVFRFGPCGMTRYYSALIKGLRELGWETPSPLIVSRCDYQSRLSRLIRPLLGIPRSHLLLDQLSQRVFRSHVGRNDYDLVLLTDPSFGRGWLTRYPNTRFVLVVHDLMTCVLAPDGLHDSAGPGLLNLLYLTRRATAVICISEDTRKALLAMAPLDHDRVIVVRTGNLLASANPPPAAVALPEQYLLFVGSRSGRKGFFDLVRAFQDLKMRHPNLRVVCTGTLQEEERDFLERYEVSGSVYAVQADDRTLVTLYQRAACLVYPSLYEGFGLPVLEAMHYGCPVITTHRGAIPEVCGDAAVMLDPEHPEELSNAINRILIDDSFAATYRERGLARAKGFSAEQMALQIHEHLASVLNP